MYETTTLKLVNKNKNFFIKIKNTIQNKKFIKSFLDTSEEVEKHLNPGSLNGDELKIDIFVKEVKSLTNYLKNNIEYEYLEKLYVNLNNQITNLNNEGLGVINLSHEDIFVLEYLDDVIFIFLNNDNLVDIDFHDKLLITKPFAKDKYCSPELNTIKKLPAIVTKSSVYWSIGKLILFCLKKFKDEKYINKNLSKENILNKIMNTRLYWAVQKNLEMKPEKRASLLI